MGGSWKEAQGARGRRMPNASASQLLGRERGMRAEIQILEGKTFLVSQKGRTSFCLLFLGQQKTYISSLSTSGIA